MPAVDRDFIIPGSNWVGVNRLNCVMRQANMGALQTSISSIRCENFAEHSSARSVLLACAAGNGTPTNGTHKFLMKQMNIKKRFAAVWLNATSGRRPAFFTHSTSTNIYNFGCYNALECIHEATVPVPASSNRSHRWSKWERKIYLNSVDLASS